MTRRMTYIVSGLFSLIILGIVGVVGLRFIRPPELHGVVLQAPEPAPDFELTATTGDRMRLSDFRGQHVLLFFGYTSCPDVCPMTLAKLKQAMNTLGSDAENVQVIMVTVDPDRDTPERLREFVINFDPSFIGMTGTEQEIASAAAPAGIYYAKSDVETNAGYLMDHTASITLIDPKGHMRMVFPPDVSGPEIAADVNYFMQ